MDKLDSDYPAYDALAREKAVLVKRAIELEARCNKMVAEATQARLLHEQDCADIASKHFENLRLRNRCTLLETRVELQSGRITELETLLTQAGAERR